MDLGENRRWVPCVKNHYICGTYLLSFAVVKENKKIDKIERQR